MTIIPKVIFHSEDFDMEHFRGKVLRGDEIYWNGIEGELTILEMDLPKSWHGWFQLPEGQHAKPDDIGCSCSCSLTLTLDDGRSGQIILREIIDLKRIEFVGTGPIK